MTVLAITKAYSTGSALTEAHLDNFRTPLLALFNTTKLTSANFSPAMSIPSAKFTGSELLTADNSYLEFGTDVDAWFGLNSSKEMVFDTAVAATEIKIYAGSTNYMEVYTDKVYVPADIEVYDSGHTILEALATYQKPVLEWESSTSVKLSNNSASSNETVVWLPDTGAIAIDETVTTTFKYRKADIGNVANGYGTGDSGAAKGGRRSGVSLTSNSWYTVYCCKLRSGSDYSATSPKYILVFDTTLPDSSNESTLDSRYGTGCWVYMGLVRYGFGADGSSTAIPKFKYSNKGWCCFYEKSSTATHGGLVLAMSSTDADNTASAFHTLTSGMSGQVIPSIVGKLQICVQRERVSEWYAKDSDSTVVWRGGWQDAEPENIHGHVVEIGWNATYTLGFYQERKSSAVGTVRSLCLVGFCDTYRSLRRQGIGI